MFGPVVPMPMFVPSKTNVLLVASAVALVAYGMRFAAPSPLKPVAMGNPVAFVSTAAEGVPRSGVESMLHVPEATTATPDDPLLLRPVPP